MDANAQLDPQVCYRAVLSRDARFDGLFFTAVKSTRIYCRSVCPARSPSRAGCTFYETAAQAERDGFRPCLRCRPELAPGRREPGATLAEALLTGLRQAALDDRSLQSIAAGFGMSGRQLRRIMAARYGLTPVEIVQTERLLFAKNLVQQTALSIAHVAQASGFGSVRRLHASFQTRYRLTPTAMRRAAAGPVGQGHELTLRLAYRAPLAWPELLQYLSRRAIGGVEAVAAGCYWRTISLPTPKGFQRGWMRVERPLERDLILVSVPVELSRSLHEIVTRTRALFDLDANPQAIDAQLALEAELEPSVSRVPGLRVPGTWDGFELGLRAILGQQISVVGASTLAARFAQRFGTPAQCPMDALSRFMPSSQFVADLRVEDVAALGMPTKRAMTIVGFARFAAQGGLIFSPGTSLQQIVDRMTALAGIGPWTAHYIAMRALRHPDAFPAGDLGLRHAMEALGAGSPVNERLLELHSRRWSPWRAYAAVRLWHSLPWKNE